MRLRVLSPLTGLVALAISCAGTGATMPAASRSVEMRYTVRVGDDLERMSIQLCFSGRSPQSLGCGIAWAPRYVRSPKLHSRDGVRELQVADRRIDLSGAPNDSCVSYEVDLGAVAREQGGLYASRSDQAMLSNAAVWLWRPPGYRDLHGARLRFELPPGAAVSTPWPRDGDSYLMKESAFGFFSFAVFGEFRLERVVLPDTEIAVALLGALPSPLEEQVASWVEAAALLASAPGGRFPAGPALVVVLPSHPASDPVGFGQVVRGGGSSVGVFLRRNAELDALKADWVLVHEFSHLWHPFVARDDAWLSEGLATYYQEVLRVRGGVRDQRYAWQRIWEGAQLRSEAHGTLAEESAAMYDNFSFRRVYWAGAAFALLADVELRRRSRGARSLDDVITELQSCCGEVSRSVPAKRVIEQMDRIAGEPVFSELYRRWVLGPELPDLAELFSALGVRPSQDGIRMRDDAPEAWIREAIMRRDEVLARRVARAGDDESSEKQSRAPAHTSGL